jgi:hypothetical protein
MQSGDELRRTDEQERDTGHAGMAFGMMAMMGLMMSMCMGTWLLFAVIPFVGWPIGIAIAAASIAAMIYLHSRMMGHGH